MGDGVGMGLWYVLQQSMLLESDNLCDACQHSVLNMNDHDVASDINSIEPMVNRWSESQRTAPKPLQCITVTGGQKVLYASDATESVFCVSPPESVMGDVLGSRPRAKVAASRPVYRMTRGPTTGFQPYQKNNNNNGGSPRLDRSPTKGTQLPELALPHICAKKARCFVKVYVFLPFQVSALISNALCELFHFSV